MWDWCEMNVKIESVCVWEMENCKCVGIYCSVDIKHREREGNVGRNQSECGYGTG